jgi:hypothetical protein
VFLKRQCDRTPGAQCLGSQQEACTVQCRRDCKLQTYDMVPWVDDALGRCDTDCTTGHQARVGGTSSARCTALAGCQYDQSTDHCFAAPTWYAPNQQKAGWVNAATGHTLSARVKRPLGVMQVRPATSQLTLN